MKYIKKVFILFILITISSCSKDNSSEELSRNILVKTIIINGNSIQNGSSEQLSVVVLPNNATNRTVTWSVSDLSIASISDKGLVTPLENGTVTITASANDDSGISSEKIITISGVTGPPILVSSITVMGTNITDGSAQQLSVEVLPADATNKLVIWSVSDPLKAEISSTGLLTPKDNGYVTVTETSKDGTEIIDEIIINISGITPIYATILKAENMLLWQRNNGGWPKEPYNDFSGYEREQTASEIANATSTKDETDTTIDNGHTITELRFLLSAYKTTNNPEYVSAAVRGIDYLFESQYDNGGWPQYYPLRNNYSRHITYNDNAMGNVMNLMRDILLKQNNLDLIDEIYLDKAKTAFDNGINVILKTQITINGTKTAWCAQHDEITLLPAKARSYELASISGSESVGVVRLLMSLENPSSEVIEAVNSAIAWFESVKIVGYALQDTGSDKELVKSSGNVMWARFYTLDNYTGDQYESLFNTFEPNEPFFCSRDTDSEGGGPRKTIAEISYERRNGYAWYGNWPTNLIGSEYTNWKNKNGF